jgi:regulatory protein YycI of two-component signal transduction system YycFG
MNISEYTIFIVALLILIVVLVWGFFYGGNKLIEDILGMILGD